MIRGRNKPVLSTRFAKTHAVVVSDHSRGEWLRIGRGLVVLARLSFGAAADYSANGGQRVVSDFSPPDRPIDISGFGAEVWPVGVPVEDVVAAFVLGDNRPISIRGVFGLKPGGPRRFYARATCGNEERIAPMLVRAERGDCEIDLLVRNLALDRVATLRETWRWEVAPADEETGVPGAWTFHASMPVRIYVTAAPAINRLACESFYHLACFAEGATDQAAAKDSLWRHFCQPAEGSITNVRGQPLTMWRTRQPGSNDLAYISRAGQGLVQEGDASCMGWAHLLMDVFAIHGIKAKTKYLEIDTAKLNLRAPAFHVTHGNGTVKQLFQVSMVIKGCRWDKTGSIPAGVQVSGDDVIEAADFRWKLDVPDDALALPWDKPDVVRQTQRGHRAAGSKSTGIFSNHIVVAIENPSAVGGVTTSWYDPCYDIGPCNTLLDYQYQLIGDGTGPDDGGLCAVVGFRAARAGGQVTNISHGYYGATPATPDLCLRASDVQQD